MNQVAQRSVLRETHLAGLKLFARGKVRDVYELAGDRLLIVATDRLSAFDVVMSEGIPDKGRVLTQLSCFWFRFLGDAVRTHYITSEMSDYPRELRRYEAELEGRSMVVERTEPYPIECVVRGYLAGSGWKEYRTTGGVCGIELRDGLVESSKLDEPIFTPSTKATRGHDENITWEETVARIGEEAACELRRRSLEVYERAAAYAESRGIIIADTKFEWGRHDREIILIDEVLTPDSSRFWPKDGYAAGHPQPSFDKQFVRDYLESVHWNKQPPPPPLPADVVERTSQKYREAYRRLTGQALG